MATKKASVVWRWRLATTAKAWMKLCFFFLNQHCETRKIVQKNGNCSRLVVASSFEFVYSFAFLVFRSVMLSQRSTLYPLI